MSKPVAWPWWQYLKIVVQAIVQDEGVCHLDAMRLHRMLIAVMVVANFWVIEVCYLSRNVKSASNTVGNIGGCCCCLEYEQKHGRYRIPQHAGCNGTYGRHAGSVDQRFTSTFRDLPIMPRTFDLMLSETT